MQGTPQQWGTRRKPRGPAGHRWQSRWEGSMRARQQATALWRQRRCPRSLTTPCGRQKAPRMAVQTPSTQSRYTAPLPPPYVQPRTRSGEHVGRAVGRPAALGFAAQGCGAPRG